MRLFAGEREDPWEAGLPRFLIGAVAGLAVGVLLSRVMPRTSPTPIRMVDAGRSAVRRQRPAKLQRLSLDQADLDQLEQTVVDRFIADDVLGNRSVDIGAISPGIIELSGSVHTESEAHRAISLANGVPGVKTVVNRLDVGETQRRASLRRRLETEDKRATFTRQEGRVGGMGRRRQDPATDPERPDDSQKMREQALAAADRDQWQDEGYAANSARNTERSEVAPENPTRFSEDELDNQDPHNKHARVTLDEQPQELNSAARVGEGPKPGLGRTRADREVEFEGPQPRDRED